MNKLQIKKGDTVMINCGSDKGKTGKVLAALPKENKVVVEGVNVRTKHTKPKKAGEAGGIIKSEVAINASKANLYCPKCKTGVRVKISTNKDGSKVKVCAKCGEKIK